MKMEANNKTKIIVDKRNWMFLLPFCFGVFVLVNSLIWIIMNGGRWFDSYDPAGEKPEYYNDLNRVFGPFFMLGYFTVQTNIFAGVMLIILGFYNYSQKAQSWFMGSVVLITITFIVFWLILAPGYENFHWKNPYFTVSNVFLHAINPILAFITIFKFKKNVVINKRIVGLCSMWMAIFYIYSAIFYGVSSQGGSDGKLVGSTVYSFLDIQKLLFIDYSNIPALGIFVNIILLIICPFLPILVSYLWIKIFKIKSLDESYFRWMDSIKKWYKSRL